MTKLNEIYKCSVCGNTVEVVDAAGGTLVCCGQDMNKLEEQTEDSSVEKHVPVVKEIDGGVEVVVGSTEHPMTEDHQIVFIEVLTADKVLRAELEAGEKPVATFAVKADEIEKVREYCNIHDLWKA